MTIRIGKALQDRMQADLEAAYPEEGAGFLLGPAGVEPRSVTAILPVTNAREDGARRSRYLIEPLDFLAADLKAEEEGLEIVGVYHSHPDCPNVPSGFDLEWALPWYSYTITRVEQGKAVNTRAWKLSEDRTAFIEEEVVD